MPRAMRILAALFLFLPFISCSKQQTPQADVVVWHWMTDRQETFEKLAAQYEKETGTRVVFETYAPSDVYRSKVRAAASGNLLPEIYSTLGDKRDLSSFIGAGHVADLTAEMNAGWKDTFFAKSLSQSVFEEGNEWNVKPGIYGVPIDVNAIMIYYNKDLFKQAGLDPENPPKTWDEFIAAGKKLRMAGIQPFVSGFGEGWLIGVFAQSYEWNLMGKEGAIDTIRGKISYNDPRWIRIYRLFAEMREAGMFASGIATMVNKDAERAFTTGKAAMALNGSWGVNVYYSMSPNLNYGVMLPPALKEGQYPISIFGGEGSTFYVNPASPGRDKAIRFLKWMTARDQQLFLSKETRNIPSNKEAAQDIPPILKTFAENIDRTFDQLPVVESWQVVNVFQNNLQAIVIGEKTAERAGADIEAEKRNQEAVK